MADSRMHPEGRNQTVTKYIQNLYSGAPIEVIFNQVKKQRFRVAIADVNAGLVLLPALPGVKWQVLDVAQISVGGAAGAATTVDLVGTQSGSAAKLLATAIAALTQSALVRAGAANATILADGASFAVNDVRTAVSASKTGASLTTSTFIDYFVEYVAIAG